MRLRTILSTMLFSLIGLTAFADDTDISTLENAVYIQSGATITINSDGDAVIPINMKNAVGVTGYQFNVVLPDGISKDNVTFKESKARKAENVSFSKSWQTDGSCKAVAYTSDDLEFSGNDGEIVTMTIANAQAGTYQFTIADGRITSHGTSDKAGVDVVSTVTVKAVSFDEGYAVTVAPFTFEEEDVETCASLTAKTALTNIEFDIEASSIISNNSLLELAKKLGTTTATTTIEENHVKIERKSTKEITDGTEILKMTFGYDPDILTEGIYTVSFKNIKMTDVNGETYEAAPYTVNIYVGSPKATATEGKVTLSGDYSDSEMATKMIESIPTTDASVTQVDLTGVTALPEGKTITMANPNALIETSTDLKLTNTKNVVIGKTCAHFEMTDGNAFATSKKFTAAEAKYSRTFESNQNWGTICLPYAVSSNSSVAYYKVSAVVSGTLTLEKYETLPANTPALVKKLSGTAIASDAENVEVGGALGDVTGVVTMKGSFTDNTEVTDANAYYFYNNTFYKCNKKFYIDAFRAYFTVAANSGLAKADAFTIGEDEDVTAINALVGESDTRISEIYGADGTKRNDLQNGMNIVKLSNGMTQKIMVK